MLEPDRSLRPRMSIGDPGIDATVQEVVERHESEIRGRVRGYYVCGSWADGTAAAHSDLDMQLVLDEPLGEAERGIAGRLLMALALNSHHALDLRYVTVDELGDGEHFALARHGALVFGRDDRPLVAPPSIDQHRRLAAQSCVRAMLAVRSGIANLPHPLELPDPAAPFCGYVTPEPSTVSSAGAASTRRLVQLVCRVATALVADGPGYIACSTSEAVASCQALIGDRWSLLIAEIYKRCKEDWRYLVPGGGRSRAELEYLCQSTLAVERRFLSRFPAMVASGSGRSASGDPS